jgi:RNAse (barnase) inhibitor barstar
MGDTLNDFFALTEQFVKDIETVYDSAQTEIEEIGDELTEPDDEQETKLLEVLLALKEAKSVASDHFQQMLNLARTYVQNLTELREGEQSNQDLPSTEPIIDPLPEATPL